MSLIGRFNHWRCDACGSEQHREGFDLPPGWGWFVGRLDASGRNRVLHACAGCRKGKTDAEVLAALTTEVRNGAA